MGHKLQSLSGWGMVVRMYLLKTFFVVCVALALLIPSTLLIVAGFAAFAESASVMHQIFAMLCLVAAGVFLGPSVAIFATLWLILELEVIAEATQEQHDRTIHSLAAIVRSTSDTAEHARAQRILLQQLTAKKPPVKGAPAKKPPPPT